MSKMSEIKSYSRGLAWSMALLLSAFAAGCGGGGGGQDPILGGGGGGVNPPVVPPPVVAIPGAACPAAVGHPEIPTVISTNPTNNPIPPDSFVTAISTAGVAGGGKLITATFSLPMDDVLTINSPLTTFTLKDTATQAPVPIVGVAMDATRKIATLTTAGPLTAGGHSYTATIKIAAKSAKPPAAVSTALACEYQWSFKTAAGAGAGQAPVDLKTAGTYGIFVVSNASLTIGDAAFITGDIGFMSNLAGSCIVPHSPANLTCVDIPPVFAGAVHNGDLAAQAALTDFNNAYTDAAGRATGLCTLSTPANIAGPQGACPGYAAQPGTVDIITGFSTYLPGLYAAGAINLPVGATIVLDAQNNPDAVFIFQATGSTLDTGVGSTIVLANQAKAKNVFWTVASAATLGVSSTFKGTVITGGGGAAAAIVNNGAPGTPTTVEGRIFSGAAGTLGHDATITVPQ